MWCVVGGGGWEVWWEEVGVWWVGEGRGCGGGGKNRKVVCGGGMRR